MLSQVGPTRSFWHLVLQYGRFGIVGGGATTIHVGMFVGLIEVAKFAPLVANVVAFCSAVLFSFFGHLHWTFQLPHRNTATSRPASHMLSKFIAVALLGLCLNSLAVYAVTEVLAMPYAYAILLMVSVVPLTVFLLSKLWVFA